MRTLMLALGVVLAAMPARGNNQPGRCQSACRTNGDGGSRHQRCAHRPFRRDVHRRRRPLSGQRFTAVIFASDATKFPNASALDGKTVVISGPVQLYQGRAEIILKTADQLKAT